MTAIAVNMMRYTVGGAFDAVSRLKSAAVTVRNTPKIKHIRHGTDNGINAA